MALLAFTILFYSLILPSIATLHAGHGHVRVNETVRLPPEAQCDVVTGMKWVVAAGSQYSMKSLGLDECCSQCKTDQPRCKAYEHFNDVIQGDSCRLFGDLPSNQETCGHGGITKCHAGRLVTPSPPPPPPPPSPGPTSWPVFNSLSELKNDPWGAYYQAVYGDLPSSYPVKVENFWMLYDAQLLKSSVQVPASVGECPTANAPSGQRYELNDQYQPRMVSWLWHQYPYQQIAANSWVEVFHQADPFGDEHIGLWFMYTPGSGIYFNIGSTIAFQEHADAYQHFNVNSGDYNEQMSKAAAAQGYDSVQFLAHVDHVNYQCDTKNTGRAGLEYMGLEIVATKLVGTFACGTSTGAPSSLKAGWMGSRECTCDNSQGFLNCKGVPSWTLKSGRSIYV